MALCFLKYAELANRLQTYKGRVVLRGDNIKDEEGYRAVFTEQGASASQMVGAKTLDACARMPGMAGSAADAVSAYTQVNMAWARDLLKLSEKECPVIWIRLPRGRWPKEWRSMNEPVVPLLVNLYGHHLAGWLWESTLRNSSLRLVGLV